MRGSEPYRQCWCRDPATGKPLRANCPKLKNKKHGKWYARYDAGGTEGKRRQPVVGPFDTKKEGSATVAKLEVPIVDDKQSAHIKITGVLNDAGYRSDNGDLVFDRTLHGLRNTVILPAGWEVSAVSQSGTIGAYQGRAFVALINLNAENSYHVIIHARKAIR